MCPACVGLSAPISGYLLLCEPGHGHGQGRDGFMEGGGGPEKQSGVRVFGSHYTIEYYTVLILPPVA